MVLAKLHEYLARRASVRIGRCHHCLCPHRRVKSYFCGDARGACAQRQAWLLCPVSDNVDNAFAKMTAPTTLDCSLTLPGVSRLCSQTSDPTVLPPARLPALVGIRRSRTSEHVQCAECEEGADRSPQNRLAKLHIGDDQIVERLCLDGVHPKQPIEAVVDL